MTYLYLFSAGASFRLDFYFFRGFGVYQISLGFVYASLLGMYVHTCRDVVYIMTFERDVVYIMDARLG